MTKKMAFWQFFGGEYKFLWVCAFSCDNFASLLWSLCTFLRQSLSLSLKLINSARLSGQWEPGIYLSRVTAAHHHIQLLSEGWASKLGTSCLNHRHFSDAVIPQPQMIGLEHFCSEHQVGLTGYMLLIPSVKTGHPTFYVTKRERNVFSTLRHS